MSETYRPFQSDLNVIEMQSGPYAGRWCIVSTATGAVVSDYRTRDNAEKALPGVRKYARERRAALKEQDKPLRW